MNTIAATPLYRTMRRSILNRIGNEAIADAAVEAIIEAHPHLAEVWATNTCFACRAPLAQCDHAHNDGLCEFCRNDNDPPEYYEENHRRYGGD